MPQLVVKKLCILGRWRATPKVRPQILIWLNDDDVIQGYSRVS